jgi:hypothetical protein
MRGNIGRGLGLLKIVSSLNKKIIFIDYQVFN